MVKFQKVKFNFIVRGIYYGVVTGKG